jgi:hypothetical protein
MINKIWCHLIWYNSLVKFFVCLWSLPNFKKKRFLFEINFFMFFNHFDVSMLKNKF